MLGAAFFSFGALVFAAAFLALLGVFLEFAADALLFAVALAAGAAFFLAGVFFLALALPEFTEVAIFLPLYLTRALRCDWALTRRVLMNDSAWHHHPGCLTPKALSIIRDPGRCLIKGCALQHSHDQCIHLVV